MNSIKQAPDNPSPFPLVPAGQDQFGEHRGLGVSAIAFKLTPPDETGLLIIENTFHQPGGPPRHLHVDQDEWFYALEGNFILEIGQQKYELKPGDSIMAPRQIPHVWAYVGQTHGRMLIAFTPAGKMASFFREVTKTNAMPGQNPDLWNRHGMQIMGPPLAVDGSGKS